MYHNQTRAKKEERLETPSQYGSHASMIVEGKEGPEPGTVVLLDAIGEYWTYVDRLDSGLADPRRFERNPVEKR